MVNSRKAALHVIQVDDGDPNLIAWAENVAKRLKGFRLAVDRRKSDQHQDRRQQDDPFVPLQGPKKFHVPLHRTSVGEISGHLRVNLHRTRPVPFCGRVASGIAGKSGVSLGVARLNATG